MCIHIPRCYCCCINVILAFCLCHVHFILFQFSLFFFLFFPLLCSFCSNVCQYTGSKAKMMKGFLLTSFNSNTHQIMYETYSFDTNYVVYNNAYECMCAFLCKIRRGKCGTKQLYVYCLYGFLFSWEWVKLWL